MLTTVIMAAYDNNNFKFNLRIAWILTVNFPNKECLDISIVLKKKLFEGEIIQDLYNTVLNKIGNITKYFMN